MSDYRDQMYGVLIGALTLFVLLVIGYKIYSCKGQQEYTLPVKDWRCTATVEREVVRMQMSGKVQVPITNLETVCVEYKYVQL